MIKDILINKELLHTRVVREILSLIASGEYSEGRRLPAERILCNRFRISRGTLRKALADLEKMGAIVIKPQSGAYVQCFSHSKLPEKILPRNFTKVSLRDIVIARKAIELNALEFACVQITNSEIDNLEQITANMEQEKENLPSYLALDMAFHEAVVKASKNEVLIAAFEAIAEYHKYSQVFSSTYDMCEEDALKYHKKILNAIMDGDTKNALRLLSDHLENMLDRQIS
jgi:DNA-binding FadR family transcriptional regulator